LTNLFKTKEIMQENITLGRTYTDQYINQPLGKLQDGSRGTRVLKRTKTKYGYSIVKGNDYVTIYTIKLYINDDGSAKAKIKVEKNYCPTYTFTVYFDTSGREIVDGNRNVRKELAYYKSIRK